MAKRRNPLFQKTSPATDAPPEVVNLDPGSLNETFPGGMSIAPPLSKREKKRLSELEALVGDNIKAYVAVGCALREIRDTQLYRETHDRFDEYVKDMWDMARCRAYQYIDAADVVDNLRRVSDFIEDEIAKQIPEEIGSNSKNEKIYNCRQIPLLPENEGQARALAKYPPEKQIEIWKEALITSKNGKITASHVRATAEAMTRQKVKRKTNTTRRDITRTPRVSDDFRAAFQAFLDQINVERASGWKNTDASEIARHLRGLLQAVEAPL
jgi:hypothetical protein